MEKLVRIVASPFRPEMEIVGNIVISLFAIHSDDSVSVKINPSVQEFKENLDQPGMQIRNSMVTADTDQTRTLEFDFESRNVHGLDVEGESYELRLMAIGKENIPGQEFPFFEFLVRWN